LEEQCAAIIRDYPTLDGNPVSMGVFTEAHTGGVRCPNPVANKGVCEEHLHWAKEPRGKSRTTNAKHKLGFNLIVKNEAKVLQACMESIRAIADEIVITDTGSSDNTIEIALQWADKVLFQTWEPWDFSAARNFSLQFSQTEWICWIDADETLMEKGLIQLKEVMRDDRKAKTIFTPLLSKLPDGRASKHYLPKLFKKGTAYFEEPVHNQLIHSIPIANAEIYFWHVGYDLDEKTMKQKRNRTSGLLKTQLKENPNNAFATMNLARTMLTDGDYKQSYETIMKGLELEESITSCRQMMLYNKAMCCVNMRHLEEAQEACWECLSINKDNLDMMFILGWSSCLKTEYAQCIVYFKRFFDLRKEQEIDGFNLLILDFWDALPQAWSFLAQAYKSLEFYNDAIDAINEAIDIVPSNPELWKNLAVVYRANKNEEMIKRTIGAMVDRGLADNQVWAEMALSGGLV